MSNNSEKATEKAGKRPVAVGGVNKGMEIPRSALVVEKGFNVRRDVTEGAAKALAADIKIRGLLNPVTVVYGDKPDTFKVVAGFTRMAALDLLGWKVIPCNVLADTSKEGAIFANLAENVARESIPTYDLAIRLADIKSRFRLSGADIAARLAAGDDEGSGKRLSKSHVNNLINLVLNLHPALLALWEAGKSGVTIPALLGVVSKPKDDQPTALAELLHMKESDITGKVTEKDGEEKGKDGAAPGAGAEDAKPRITKPSEEILRVALKTVDSTTVKMTENEKDALLACLRFALGMEPNLNLGVRVIFSPEQYKANLKALQKEAKEKAKAGAAVPSPT